MSGEEETGSGSGIPQLTTPTDQTTPTDHETTPKARGFVLTPLAVDHSRRDSVPGPETILGDHTTPFDQEDPAVDILAALRPHVFLGSDDAATNLDEIQRNSVTHILNMAKECPNHFELITEAGLAYCRANLVDSPFEDFYNFIPAGIHFIETVPLDKAILVHCGAGISRSPAMVIAYLMYKLGYRLQEAVDLVKRRRARSRPDLFLAQLRDFERFLDKAGHFNYRDACHARGLPFKALPLPRTLPDVAPAHAVPPDSQPLRQLADSRRVTAPPDEQRRRAIEAQQQRERQLRERAAQQARQRHPDDNADRDS